MGLYRVLCPGKRRRILDGSLSLCQQGLLGSGGHLLFVAVSSKKEKNNSFFLYCCYRRRHISPTHFIIITLCILHLPFFYTALITLCLLCLSFNIPNTTHVSNSHIPGVRFAGLIHPGLIGTAPSMELLRMWNAREAKLVREEGTADEKTLCGCLHTRPLACLPEPTGAMLGKLGHFKTHIDNNNEEWLQIAKEAARTVPGRENGGNCDIKNLSRGCTVYFPVFVDGANLSMGDMHFSQGDGEVSFCGAIEMSGFLDLKCTIIQGGMKMLPVVGPSPLSVNPIFEIGPLEPRYSEWLVFEGISVDEQGQQHYLDATIAYKRAVLNCIKYLSQFGYSEEQVYLLLSCCPCEGRISGIVDVPNAVATLAIPLAIFDKDVRPPSTLEGLASGGGVQVRNNICMSTEGGAVPKDPRLDE
jgi:formamidase